MCVRACADTHSDDLCPSAKRRRAVGDRRLTYLPIPGAGGQTKLAFLWLQEGRGQTCDSLYSEIRTLFTWLFVYQTCLKHVNCNIRHWRLVFVTEGKKYKQEKDAGENMESDVTNLPTHPHTRTQHMHALVDPPIDTTCTHLQTTQTPHARTCKPTYRHHMHTLANQPLTPHAHICKPPIDTISYAHTCKPTQAPHAHTCKPSHRHHMHTLANPTRHTHTPHRHKLTHHIHNTNNTATVPVPMQCKRQ